MSAAITLADAIAALVGDKRAVAQLTTSFALVSSTTSLSVVSTPPKPHDPPTIRLPPG